MDLKNNKEKNEKKSNITFIKTQIESRKKKINKKKLIIVSIIGVMCVALTIAYLIYANNEEFRTFCDEYILKKNIEDSSLSSITIDNISNSNIFAFSNYIVTLKDNMLTQYNSDGKSESELKVEISTPLVSISDNYMVIAENGGQKLYLISKGKIVWEKEVEGNISRVSVNLNGYVSVILSGTAYKSVISVYDDTGNELFKTYLSTTIAIDSEISEDNKYVGFAEVNSSGTMIQSNIKIISIDKAKEKPSDSIVYTYNAEDNSLILNIKYQEKNKLICMYDDAIHLIENESDTKIIDINMNNDKTTFSDIELVNYIYRITEKNEGLFNTKSAVEIINISNNSKNTYNLDGTINKAYSYGDKIGIDLGNEVYFINTNGWLVKRYSSSQEIRGISMSNKIAAVIYKDKIKIINL